MTVELPFAQASGLKVTAWKAVDGELHVRVPSFSDEYSIICRCGRHHWMVRTVLQEGRAILAVRCHSCGSTLDFPLEGFSFRPP
ncbi:MAG: hypothetical protein HY557_02510 [Euryarchaeota archaeon]|nr:hypothetical protein [Euryarchaeota archaeon]